MNTDWENFLTLQGASFFEGIIQHFADADEQRLVTEQENILMELGQFSTLRVSGTDAQSFLQNLFSNDIREVSANKAQFSSFNTAKGRMLANFLVWQTGEDYFLQLPCTLAVAILKKLSMYILRAKVKIIDVSCDVIALGISGNDAASILSVTDLALLGVQPFLMPSVTIIKLSPMRFILHTPLEHAPALWKTLSEHCRPVGSVYWDWLTLRAGIPVIQFQTQEQFVPQMVNFDLIGGINFKKGCYPGQEIVARMHYLGKLKRRMYLAHVNDAQTPMIGEDLYSAEMGGQACGTIANVAISPKGGYDLLAVVQITSHDNEIVHLSSGAQLNFEALPYPLA